MKKYKITLCVYACMCVKHYAQKKKKHKGGVELEKEIYQIIAWLFG